MKKQLKTKKLKDKWWEDPNIPFTKKDLYGPFTKRKRRKKKGEPI